MERNQFANIKVRRIPIWRARSLDCISHRRLDRSRVVIAQRAGRRFWRAKGRSGSLSPNLRVAGNIARDFIGIARLMPNVQSLEQSFAHHFRAHNSELKQEPVM